MRRIYLMLAALMIIHTSAAVALDCAAPVTQKDMDACAFEAFLDAGKPYADSYQKLAEGLSAAQKKRLQRMQKAWMEYRTQACDFESSASQGGSVQAWVKWHCMTRMTQQRTDELKHLSHCVEGDVSCVQPTVKIYRAIGSTQCTPGSGTPAKTMLNQLAARNIPVRAMSCGSDGNMHATVCGAADGSIRIFEIPANGLTAATALGFAPLSEIPNAQEVPCR